MSQTQGGMTRDQISAAIAEKAWTDETFHREVLANPNAAYEKYLGQPLPAGVTLKVVEDTPNTVHFVIPAKPVNAGELSDAELENVAGGITPTVVAVSTAVLSATISVASGISQHMSIKHGKW